MNQPTPTAGALRAADISGQRFGRLIAVKRVGVDSGRTSLWFCKCDCGNEKTVRLTSLRNGSTQSCGCLYKESRRACGGRRHFKDNGIAARNHVLNTYKQQAKQRGLAWELPDEEFFKLIQGPCWYCGKPPSLTMKSRYQTGDYIYNGIDRVDNSKHYTLNNVMPCCVSCNGSKWTHEQQDFIDRCERVAERRGKIIPALKSGLAECASTIEFLMAQIERLAGKAFANYEDTEQWLDRNDAMNAGKRTLAKLNNPNASVTQPHPKGRWT